MISIATSSYPLAVRADAPPKRSDGHGHDPSLSCSCLVVLDDTHNHAKGQKASRPYRTPGLEARTGREDVKEGIDNRVIDDGSHKDPCI